MKEKINNYTISICFTICAILFLVLGFISWQNNIKNKEHTTAIVTHVEKNTNASKITDYDVYIKYEVDNQSYFANLKFLTDECPCSEGKNIEIYYNKNDVSKVEVYNTKIITENVTLILLGVIALIISPIAYYTESKTIKLKENGKRVEAKYIQTVTTKGKKTYNIICKWREPNTEIEYEFKSNDIWDNPRYAISQNNIEKIPVYIDPENPKKYYVDTKEILEKIDIWKKEEKSK